MRKRHQKGSLSKINGSWVVQRMERGTGIEPATSSLGSWHSTAELPPRSGLLAAALRTRSL